MIAKTLLFAFAFACLLTACPPDDNDTMIDTASDGSSSSSSTGDVPDTEGASQTSAMPEPTTTTNDATSTDTSTGDSTEASTGDSTGPSTGLDCHTLEEILDDEKALEAKCEKHPWGYGEECMQTGMPTPTCQEMMQILVNHSGCENIDLCDYIVCADAMAEAVCQVRPAECDPIIQCLNTEAPLTELERTYFDFLKLFTQP